MQVIEKYKRNNDLKRQFILYYNYKCIVGITIINMGYFYTELFYGILQIHIY